MRIVKRMYQSHLEKRLTTGVETADQKLIDITLARLGSTDKLEDLVTRAVKDGKICIGYATESADEIKVTIRTLNKKDDTTQATVVITPAPNAPIRALLKPYIRPTLNDLVPTLRSGDEDEIFRVEPVVSRAVGLSINMYNMLAFGGPGTQFQPLNDRIASNLTEANGGRVAFFQQVIRYGSEEVRNVMVEELLMTHNLTGSVHSILCSGPQQARETLADLIEGRLELPATKEASRQSPIF